MYLLQLDECGKLSLVRHNTDDLPLYAILSHTWGPDADELTFGDVMASSGHNKAGFAKVRFCGEQAKKHGLQYFWVDSCCINKDSSSELSEAIISMFRWYKRASRCYVYLQDVSTRKRNNSGQTEGTWEVAFQNSRWFTRGWTLQELLAPKTVEFFSRDQDLLGDKVTLETLIITTTGIPAQALRGEPLSGFSVEERLRWVATRQTQREEDKAYCLMGIFNVLISPMYGEREHAFYRLREAISSRRSQHQSISIARRPRDVEDSGHTSIATERKANLEDHREALIASLEFEQMNTRRSTIKNAHSTTCRWLLLHAAYIAWDDPAKPPREHDILWLNGKPGTGKSTIIKWAFLHTKKKKKNSKDEILLSFFFNARGDELEKTTVGMYRSLLHQLFRDTPDLRSILDEIDTEALESDLPSLWTLEILKGLFIAAVAGLGRRRLKCFIDALDECEEQQIRDMVMMFEDLSDSALEGGTQLCICFASRHYPEIRIKRGLGIVLENEDGHSEDLKHFIQRQLAAGDDESDERIRRRIQEKSNGVFMWAVLVIDILNPEYRAGRMWTIEKKLEEIPEKLSELFKTILRRDNANMDDLLLCLQWILFASRPLRAEEFYFAMAAKLDQAQPGPWNPETVTNEHIARFVVGSSKGLAELTKSVETPTVQFIHESVRDYLIKDGGLCELWPHISESLISSSHEQLKQCCQNYLAIDLSEHTPPLQNLPKPSSPAGKTLRDDVARKFPFLEYASKQVFYHADQAAKDLPQKEFLLMFALDAWLPIINVFQRYNKDRHTPDVTLLYVLAESNSGRLIRSTSKYGRWDCIPGERYGIPLLAAFSNGNQDALAALMDADGRESSANDLAKDAGFGRASELRSTDGPLSWAAKNHSCALAEYLGSLIQEDGPLSLRLLLGRCRVEDILMLAANDGLTTVFRRIMEMGPDVYGFRTHNIGIVLCVAAENQRDAIVQMILDNSANHNLALPSAAERGNEKVVQMLLGAGADVDAWGGKSGNALQAASQTGCKNVVQMLLDAGANVRASGGEYGNALCAASAGGHENVVQMLLGAEADANAEGALYRNALYVASDEGHEKVVQMLLDGGADAKAQGRDGSNALYAASRKGYSTVVQMLLDAGAAADGKGENRGEVLQAAVTGGHEKVVQMLLKAGADVNADAGGDGSALQWASHLGHDNVIPILLKAGARVNAQGGRSDNALQAASRGGHDKVVRMLLDAGADADAQAPDGSNALYVASRDGHEKVVRMLLDAGAKANARGRDGSNALHVASELGYERVVRMLLDGGADVHAPGKSDGNVLYAPSLRGHKKVVQMLLAAGAKVNTRAKQDGNAVKAASLVGNKKILQMLLAAEADASVQGETSDNALQPPSD